MHEKQIFIVNSWQKKNPQKFSGFFYVMILKINLEKQFLSEINDQNNELSLPFSRFFKISDGEIIYCKK